MFLFNGYYEDNSLVKSLIFVPRYQNICNVLICAFIFSIYSIKVFSNRRRITDGNPPSALIMTV